jgi:hypothetical protein
MNPRTVPFSTLVAGNTFQDPTVAGHLFQCLVTAGVPVITSSGTTYNAVDLNTGILQNYTGTQQVIATPDATWTP